MIKDKHVLIVIGQLSLALSILLNHFVAETPPVSFLVGLFTGLAIVFNLTYLIRFRSERSRAE